MLLRKKKKKKKKSSKLRIELGSRVQKRILAEFGALRARSLIHAPGLSMGSEPLLACACKKKKKK